MSDELREAIRRGDPEAALHAATEALEADEVRPLAETLLELLAGEGAWTREGARQVLRRLPPDARLVELLIAALSEGSHPDRRNSARSALAELTTPGARDPSAPLPLLIRALHDDPDSDVRLLCANALGESGNPRAREALEAALGDPEPNVVAAAAEALGEVKDPRALDALIALAEKRDFWTGNAAVVALGALGDPRASPALERLTTDPWLAAAAARALGQVGDAESLEALRDMVDMPEEPRRAALRAAAQILGRSNRPAPEWLRLGLRDEEVALEQELEATGDPECARLLGLAGTRSAIETLLDHLWQDPEGAAVVGLEHAPAEIRAEAILSRLDGASVEELPTLLSLLPPLEAREDLRRVSALLRSEEEEVRAAAADALGRVEVEKVLAVLEESRRDPRARLGVALAYGRLGSQRCAPLAEMLHDPDAQVRAAAAAAAGRCGVATARQLIAALRRETDEAAARALIRALGTDGSTEAVTELERVLASADAPRRFEAVRALGSTGSPEAFRPVVSVLGDPDPGIRAVALAALGELGDARAEEPLARHIHDPDRDRRRIAAVAIQRLSSRDAVQHLEAALGDPDREVRLVAIKALGRLRLPSTVAALDRVAAEDEDALVRHTAALVAAGLQERPSEDS